MLPKEFEPIKYNADKRINNDLAVIPKRQKQYPFILFMKLLII